MTDPLSAYAYRFAAAASPEAPALALFHGTGGDAEDMLAFGAAIAPGSARLAVRGDVLEHGMRRFFRRRAEGVYDMDDLARRTEALDAFLAQALPAHGFDPARTVGVGYSNGANILANLAFTAPRRFRRLALAHPLIPFEPPKVDLAGLDVLITAGRADPIGPAHLTERLAAALTARGAAVETVWHGGGHELQEAEIDAIRSFVARAVA